MPLSHFGLLTYYTGPICEMNIIISTLCCHDFVGLLLLKNILSQSNIIEIVRDNTNLIEEQNWTTKFGWVRPTQECLEMRWPIKQEKKHEWM